MRKPLLLVLLVALGACGPVDSVETVVPPEEMAETEEALVSAPAHLKFFGYYASAMAGVGSGNYITEISNHANLVWIAGGSEVPKLVEARSRGAKAVVDVSQYFFDGDFKLVPDYQQRWNAAVPRFTPYLDTVAAFYPLDEPFHHARKRGRPDAQTRAILETIAATIKRSFPNAAIAGIFTVDTIVRNDFVIPRGYDLVAFDCYGTWFNCDGTNERGDEVKESVPELVERLHQKMLPQQRMFLVPDAFIRGDDGPKFLKQLGLVDRSKRYYKLATEKSYIVGIVPFLWQSFNDPTTKYIGARDLESSFGPADVKKINERIGRKVTHR